MGQKRLFNTIFLLLTILLVTLPFLVILNNFLTKTMERFTLYTFIQDRIVPVEVAMVATLVRILGIKVAIARNGFFVYGTFLEMTWNCIGWQSLLLLGITLLAGLKSGSYTKRSMLQVILIGLLGTFIVNLLRLTFIVILFVASRPIYAVVYHEYLAAVVTIIWLFFFWWFSYSFVLEEKEKRRV